jgi:hypothetical protein
MSRELLINTGLKVDATIPGLWQFWTGTKTTQTAELLQSNGTRPKIMEFAKYNATDSLIRDLEQAGSIARYTCRLWYDEALEPSIKENVWYWISEDDGATFERYRSLKVIRDRLRIKWVIVLGETSDRLPY